MHAAKKTARYAFVGSKDMPTRLMVQRLPPSRSDAPGAPPVASLSNDDPSSVVFSGFPPVDSRVDEPEGSASQSDLSDPPAVNPRSDAPGVAPGPSRPKGDSSSVVRSSVFSVDLRDNQLDEIASQSILADLPAVHRGPAVPESDMIGCQIGSPQLVAEAQIPNLPTSVVDQTPVIGSSQVKVLMNIQVKLLIRLQVKVLMQIEVKVVT